MKPPSKTREFWLSLVQEFERAEGLTHAEYARMKGVKLATFRHWLYQIRGEQSFSTTSVNFVELTTTFAAPPSPQPGTGGRLYLGKRVMLEFDRLPDIDYLALLLGELEG